MRLLFVCAGNICRSPMAEALFRRRAAAVPALAEVQAASAGVIALTGNPASPAVVSTLRDEYGIDIAGHRASSFDPTADDLVVALDSWVGARARDLAPGARIVLVGDFAGAEGEEVEDPYGGSIDDYRRAAAHIDRLVAAIVDRLVREGSS